MKKSRYKAKAGAKKQINIRLYGFLFCASIVTTSLINHIRMIKQSQTAYNLRNSFLYEIIAQSAYDCNVFFVTPKKTKYLERHADVTKNKLCAILMFQAEQHRLKEAHYADRAQREPSCYEGL